MPSDKPVKAFIERISSVPPEKLPSPPLVPRESRETVFARLTESRKVEIKPRDRTQVYFLIQNINRKNPASARKLKMDIAKEIQDEAAKGENAVYLTISSAMDIVEREYQEAIETDLTKRLEFARARFKKANEILHPVMSKGFRVGIEPDDE